MNNKTNYNLYMTACRSLNRITDTLDSLPDNAKQRGMLERQKTVCKNKVKSYERMFRNGKEIPWYIIWGMNEYIQGK
jgi:hypothetical protein